MSSAETLVSIEVEDPTNSPVRFHLSLNVGDLKKSVDFFRVFFGIEPAKHREDYAKFELDEPPVVLSLEPFKAPPGGNLNHLGFRMPTAVKLVEFQRRLEMAGFSTQREEGVECCYARQTKFWVHDPDGNLWEIYTFDGDIEHRGAGQLADDVVPQKPAAPKLEEAAPPPAIWAHRLGERFPNKLPIDDGTVDQVMLQGTFNAELTAEQPAKILAEVFRVLKPNGEVNLHVLTCNRPVGDTPLQLPGPAAAVKNVPVDRDLVASLEAAGFADLQFTKLGDSPCFVVSGIQMRETKMTARRPASATESKTKSILYKGPFRQMEDDAGNVFRRGQRVLATPSTWERLKNAGLRDSFLCEDA